MLDYLLNPIKALLVFARTFLGPMDETVNDPSFSPFIAVKGMKSPPEWEIQKMAQSFFDKKKQQRPDIFGFLVGIKGFHCGEIFPLAQDIINIGNTLQCQVVITPSQKERFYRLQLHHQGDVLTASASPGEMFKHLGSLKNSAELFDCDEVEFAGNTFIYFADFGKN